MDDNLINEKLGKTIVEAMKDYVVLLDRDLKVQYVNRLAPGIRKEDVIIAGYGFRVIFIVFALVQVPKAMNTVISGSLRGAGDIQWIMWVNIIAVLLLEIGVNWVGAFIFHFGLMGIWAVQMGDEIFKSSINYKRFISGKWKLIRI